MVEGLQLQSLAGMSLEGQLQRVLSVRSGRSLFLLASAVCACSSCEDAASSDNHSRGVAGESSVAADMGGTNSASGGTGTGIAGAGGMDQASFRVPGDCRPLHGKVTSVTKGAYCVDGDVIIPEDTTLEVPAGTTFIFMGRYHFGRDPSSPDDEGHPSGSVRAIGTAKEPIVFRGETADTAWYGIVIYHASAIVQLEHVTIRDTYKDDTDPNSRIWRRGGGLNSYVNASGTIIRHCTFLNNRARSIAGALAINSHGVWPNEGPVEITDSLFEDNSCECAVYSGSDTDLCGGGAIRFSHVGGDEELVKIRNNTFRSNEAKQGATIAAYGGAIGGFDDGITIGPGNVFQNNAATMGDGAISCAGQAQLGVVIDAVDASVAFSGNSPNIGCGL